MGEDVDQERARRIQIAADASAAAYGFTGGAKERVNTHIRKAFTEGREPDWEAIRARAGRELTDAALREQGLSDEEIAELRRHFRGS